MPRKQIEPPVTPREPDAVIPPRRDSEPEPGFHEQSVLDGLESFPEDIRRGPVAANMIGLAREWDVLGLMGRDSPGHAREIRQSYMALREMAPGERKGDKVDELNGKRGLRLVPDAGA